MMDMLWDKKLEEVAKIILNGFFKIIKIIHMKNIMMKITF